jgi:4-amino-4-deoxy-L-arabinose transferase-like glycosyltransferase
MAAQTSVPRPIQPIRRRERGRELELGAIALITLGAAVLRLLYIGRVSPDPFYDAAVRSMSLSWHNFFFGAFEPGGSVSIDKPPVDLWLQVVSVKVLGFSSTTLKLPEIFAGIASVPLLYDIVRRVWSGLAGVLAAVCLAVLPVEVLTSRSDTMDAVMMALILLALWLVVRACETGRTRWLLAGAAALGVSFDVKLLESIVALPALLVFALIGLRGTFGRRLLLAAAAGAVYVAIALSWLAATLLVPAHERPWAIGATNGSAWNAAFVFNGTDRLGSKSPEPQFTVYEPGHHYPEATQSERDHIPIVPPSPTRLLARVGPLSGQRLGLQLLIALLLGIPAFIVALRRKPVPRIRWAAVAGLTLWALTGIVLFSHMARLHPRYVESFVPAVAAMFGIGLAWAGRACENLRLGALTVALLASVYYVERLEYGTTAVWWVTALAACGAFAAALAVRVLRPGGPLAGAAAISLSLVAFLAMAMSSDIDSIRAGVTDAGYVGALPTAEQQPLSAYLRAHQGSARYEVAAESATQIGSLIVQDARPILVLTTYNARVFTTVPRLQRLIAKGEVRYALLNSACGKRLSSVNAACAAPARWIRAHGKDVSREARLPRGGVLWLLPGAKP